MFNININKRIYSKMEYENPWADKLKMIHKNVKAVKPEPRKPKMDHKQEAKINEDKSRAFVEELLKHAFRKLNKEKENELRKTFEETYDGAIREVEKVREEILGSLFLPDRKTIIMLGYMCMLRDSAD